MWEPGLQKTKTILNTNSLIFFLPGKIKIYFPVYIVVLFIIRVVVEVLGFMNILDYVNYIKCKMCQKKVDSPLLLSPSCPLKLFALLAILDGPMLKHHIVNSTHIAKANNTWIYQIKIWDENQCNAIIFYLYQMQEKQFL